jgi:hypothetical protein
LKLREIGSYVGLEITQDWKLGEIEAARETAILRQCQIEAVPLGLRLVRSCGRAVAGSGRS